MVHVISFVFIWYMAAWKNKNIGKFYMSVQPCKIQQVLSLCFTIILNWMRKLTKLTWLSSSLIHNVKSYEMKCTDLNLISREIKGDLKEFGCTLFFIHCLSDCQSCCISHLTKLSIISPYQMVLFWFMLSFDILTGLHIPTYLTSLCSAMHKASIVIVSAKCYLKWCVWFQ